MREAEVALRWISELLRRRGVPFQVAGGLAARSYGATRELHDIDLYAPGSRFADFLPDIGPHLVSGPEHVIDRHWDIVFLKILYRDQAIEIGDGENTRIFSRREGKWYDESIDFADFEMRQVLGVSVPVMKREKLLAYKRRLDRDVDRIDVAQIESASADNSGKSREEQR